MNTVPLTHTFDGGFVTVLADDILQIEYTNEEPLGAEHIIATRDLRKKVLGEIPYYAIIDMRKGFISFTKEAKQWAAENEESSKIRLLDILLVNNFGLKMEATLYLKLFKPKVPTKVVTSIEAAYKEIEKHKKSMHKAAG